MITSKLTAKTQTTIPQAVRNALRLQEGDRIVYRIEGQNVVLSRAEHPSGREDPFATFGEWHGEADQRAYDKL